VDGRGRAAPSELRKIEALFARAGTDGERQAAGAALERIRERLARAQRADRVIEIKFTFPDGWARRLFLALCRRYGLHPYRYKRQRRTTVMLRARKHSSRPSCGLSFRN